MLTLHVLALAALLVAGICPAASQTCETFAGYPTGCAAFLNGSTIWLPPNTTQAEVAAALDAQTNVSLLLSFAALAPTCINTAVSFLCRQAFPICVTQVGSAGPVSLFSPLCQAACLNVTSICAEVLANPQAAQLGVKAPNCSAESFVFPPAPLYPNGKLSLTLGPDTFSLPCDSNSIGKPEIKCPRTRYQQLYPIPDDEPKTPGINCWACPILVYTSGENLLFLRRGASILGGIAAVACVLTMLPVIATPRRRVYPSVLVVYLSIATMVSGLVIAMQGVVGYERTFCASKTSTGGYSHPPCVLDGFFLYVSALSSTAWMTAIVFDLWWAVGLQRQRKPWFHQLYLGLAWGIPFTLGIILLMRQYSFNNIGFCGIGDFWPVGSTKENLHSWINVAFWYMPNGFMWLWCTGALSFTIYKCLKLSKNVRGAMLLVRNQWRTFVYFIWQFTSLGYLMGNWFHLEKNRILLRRGAEDFFTCVFTSTDPEACEPHLPAPRWPVQMGLIWIVSALGIWTFIVFGLTMENWKFYKYLFTRAHDKLTGRSTVTEAETPGYGPSPVASYDASQSGVVSRI